MSHAKDDGRRQRRNLPKIIDGEIVPEPGDELEERSEPETPAESGYDVPPPPAGLPDGWMLTWRRLWTSPVAALLDPVSDWPAASRLFKLYVIGDRLDKLMDDRLPEVDTELVSSRTKVATESRLIEAQLGLSPRARLALGVALLAGRRAAGGFSDGPGGGEHDDADD